MRELQTRRAATIKRVTKSTWTAKQSIKRGNNYFSSRGGTILVPAALIQIEQFRCTFADKSNLNRCANE